MSSDFEYCHRLKNGAMITKPSTYLINMATQMLESKDMAIIHKVPRYDHSVIFTRGEQKPYCRFCARSLVVDPYYDEFVHTNCKYVGNGYCTCCHNEQFEVFRLE